MNRHRINKRNLLKLLGLTACSALLPSSQEALARSREIFASAYFHDNEYGMAVLTNEGDILFKIALPSRGHDVVFSKNHKWGVVFARRPGNFALAFDPLNQFKPISFATAPNRHFYGHGVFSADNNFLYATENDFDNSLGIIGIYDVRDGFKRVGEFWSGGVGPHDILLHPNETTLVVANGGIQTHPDFGRSKLNLNSMHSNIVFLDVDSTAPLAGFSLGEDLQKLSLRHLTLEKNGTIWIAGQYQEELADFARLPLLAKIMPDSGLQSVRLPKQVNRAFKGYIGSIAVCDEQLAASSPKGNICVKIDLKDTAKSETVKLAKVSGLASGADGFIYSSHEGIWGNDTKRRQSPYFWDNHIAVF